MSLANRDRQIASLRASMATTYSTLVVDNATQSWRRDHQAMAPTIILKMYLEVDFLPSAHPK